MPSKLFSKTENKQTNQNMTPTTFCLSGPPFSENKTKNPKPNERENNSEKTSSAPCPLFFFVFFENECILKKKWNEKKILSLSKTQNEVFSPSLSNL